MYLLAYARAMITMYFALDEAPCAEPHEQDGFSYMKSNYHYELDYGPGCATFIKSIVKNSNISGRRRVFVLRGAFGDSQLKHVLDSYNATYVIVSKTVANIDSGVLSRSLMLRLPFKSSKLEKLLQMYDVNMPGPGKSVVRAIAKVEETSYEKKLKMLVGVMTIEKSGVKVARAIREYCQNAYQKHIPLSVIGRKVIDIMSEHPRICDIVSVCAGAEHGSKTGTKELYNYEQMFARIWHLVGKKSC